MKQKILPLLLPCLYFFSCKQQDDIFNAIEQKTWFTEGNFAGEQLVFYESANGLKKVIRQVLGSGVHVTRSYIYDVAFSGQTIHLQNGLDLVQGKPTTDIQLTYKKDKPELVSANNYHYSIRGNNAVIYNWQGNYRSGETLLILDLKKIPIEKKSIYAEETFRAP